MSKTRRERSKYAGLDKSVNLKIRHELLDFDYLDKLSEKDKMWLSTFMREYSAADLRHPNKKLHRSKKHKKSIYDANNARNRDAFAVTKSNGMLKSIKGKELGKDNSSNSYSKEIIGPKSTLPNEVEDVLITILDLINASK